MGPTYSNQIFYGRGFHVILTGAIFTAAIFTGFLRPGFVRPDFQGFFGERSEPTHFVGVFTAAFCTARFSRFLASGASRPFLRDFHGRDFPRPRFCGVFSRPQFSRPQFSGVFGERSEPTHFVGVLPRPRFVQRGFTVSLRPRFLRPQFSAFSAVFWNGRTRFMPHYGGFWSAWPVACHFAPFLLVWRRNLALVFWAFSVLYPRTFCVPVTLLFKNAPFLTVFWNGHVDFTPNSRGFGRRVLSTCHSGAFLVQIFGVFGFLPGNFCVAVTFPFRVSPFWTIFWNGRLRLRLYGGRRRR